MADSVIVESLAEFYTVEQIRGFWQQAVSALIERSSTVIHINSLSEDGQSSGGIALSDPVEIRAFIENCKAAIRKLEGGGLDPGSMSRGTDWSHRRVLP